MRERLTVRVPATTANMGPGFDCLGMALDVWNSVNVEPSSSGLEIIVEGEGADSLPTDASNLMYKGFRLPFDGLAKPVPSVRMTCHNEIPLGRGLGSSSAAAVAGLLAGSEMCGASLSLQRLLELAAEIEGHPDNAAPALLGGCQVVVRENGALIAASVPVPNDLMAVVFVPDVPMPTAQARDLLPLDVDRGDAVYNIGRVALLVRAFATGRSGAPGRRHRRPAASASATGAISPDAEHLPRRPRRRSVGGVPVRRGFQRARADSWPGVHYRLRDGGHSGQVRRRRLNVDNEAGRQGRSR